MTRSLLSERIPTPNTDDRTVKRQRWSLASDSFHISIAIPAASMPNKRDAAGASVARRGKGTQRPSSKGNTLALEDHDESMTDGQQREAARRSSNPTADGVESDVSSDQTIRARKKAEPVKSACVQCQKRKTKCSGQRPVCRFCADRNLTCSWDIGDGLTRTADLKRKLVEASGRSDNLDTLVHAMRDGSDEVSTMLLARLRLGVSVKDLALSIRSDASEAEQKISMQSSDPSSQSSERYVLKCPLQSFSVCNCIN